MAHAKDGVSITSLRVSAKNLFIRGNIALLGSRASPLPNPAKRQEAAPCVGKKICFSSKISGLYYCTFRHNKTRHKTAAGFKKKGGY
jgi:hypothetical protein